MADRATLAAEDRIDAALDACVTTEWVSWSESNCGPGDPYNVGESG